MAADERIVVTVGSVKRETDTVKSYELRPVDNELLPAFTPGAHIDLYLDNGLTRSYSLMNCSSERDRYLLAVEDCAARSRGGSRWVHENLRVGCRLTISPIRNHFPLEVSASHSVLIAGGIGITPLLAMAKFLERHQRSWELHYCAREPARAAFLSEISRPYERGKLTMHFSDTEGMPNYDEMVRGKCPDTHFYCCGPAGMLDAFLRATTNHARRFVHIERFTGSAGTLDNEFDLILAESHRTVRVRKGETILDRLLEEGIHVPNSCRQGVCGTCEVRLLAGRADHRDMILTEAEKAANETIFVCCSGSIDPSLTLKL